MTPDRALMGFYRRTMDTFSPMTVDDLHNRTGIPASHIRSMLYGAKMRDYVISITGGHGDIPRYAITPHGERYVRGLMSAEQLVRRKA